MMKKVISLVLALVLCLSLCACGGSDKDKLIGKWSASVNVADMVNESISSAGEGIEEYVSIDKLEVKFDLEFKKDDTCAMSVDAAHLEAQMDDLLDTVLEGTLKYMEDMFADQGFDMSIDEMLELSGVSKDDLRQELANSIDFSDMFEEVNFEGNFKASKGKLYMSTSLDEEVDESVYETYKLDGDKLTIDTGNGQAADFFPMTFERVK